MVLAVLVRVCYGGLRDVIYSNLEIKKLELSIHLLNLATFVFLDQSYFMRSFE